MSWRMGRAAANAALDELCEPEPRVVGRGPLAASTVTDIERWPAIVFDTNGYYARLGVHPRATKLQIRQAYERLNGQSSPLLTYIVKILLNDDKRREYDLTPSNAVFFDRYVAEFVKREALSEMAEQGDPVVDDGEQVFRLELDHLLNRAFDPNTAKVVDSKDPWRHTSPSGASTTWPWSFYLWGTSERDDERLARWQELLLRALRKKEVRTRIAVGLQGWLESPWEVALVGDQIVAFLRLGETPTWTKAFAAAHRVAQITGSR